MRNGLFRISHGFRDVEAADAASTPPHVPIDQPHRMEMIDNVLCGSGARHSALAETSTAKRRSFARMVPARTMSNHVNRESALITSGL